jgi:hypothetical protein
MREMTTGRRSTRWVGAVALMCAAVGTGCHRGYIYGNGVAPVIEGQHLVIESPETGKVTRATIRTISVAPEGKRSRWEPAHTDDAAYLRAGALPPDVDVVKISVDNTATVWGDWALGGFGVGLTATLGLVAAVGGLSPELNRLEAFDLGLTLLISALIGLEFALIGAALGELFEGQDVDHRLAVPSR